MCSVALATSRPAVTSSELVLGVTDVQARESDLNRGVGTVVTVTADVCSQFGLQPLRWVQGSCSVLFIMCL